VKPVYITLAALLTVLFLLCAVCEVHAEDVIRIDDFSGGLNTKAGLFHIKPNQARECLNWDLSDEYGALKIRNGYTKVGGGSDTNSLLSIYAHYYRDGRKELFGVKNIDSASWGVLLRSGDHRIVLDTNVRNFLYTGAEWNWCSWKDKIILANGRQKPLIWNGKDCRPLSLAAPGEFLTTPIVTTKGHLNGEYRYVIQIKSQTGTTYRTSYITPPIRAYNEGVVLHGFAGIAPDSTNSDTSASGVIDNVDFFIGRTKAYSGDLTDSVNFYRIRYWDQGADTGYFKNIPISALDTLTWIDTIGDSNLTPTGSDGFIWLCDARMYNAGRDTGSTPTINARRFGMPGYVGYDSASDSLMGLVQPSGWLLPEDSSSRILATCYMMTYFDSANGIESDSGRALYITPEVEDTAHYYKIGLPPRLPSDTALYRILYKAFQVERITGTPDSIYIAELGIWMDRYDYVNFMRTVGIFPSTSFLTGAKNVDTILVGYYPLATITDSSTIYVDSVIWDSLRQKDIYYRAQIPHNLNHPFVYGDRLWGFENSRLFYSFLDSVGYWGIFQNFAFNLDDGDKITAAFPDREYITIFKNRSQHVIYQDNDGKYSKKWTVRGRGCVAPNSLAFYDGGYLYLAENGVFYESAMPAKDKGTERKPLSDAIADLIDYPISELDDAEGFIYQDKYLLSFPAKDTTYVYDFKSGGWYIWNFAFECAINYDTVFRSGLVLSSDMLFITGSDSAIYKFDTTTTDNGADIIARWKSGPIARSARNVQVNNMGFWTGNDTSFSCVLYDAEDTAYIDSMKITPDDRHYLKSPAINESNYFYIKITNLPDTTVGLEINGIDVYVKQGTAEINH